MDLMQVSGSSESRISLAEEELETLQALLEVAEPTGNQRLRGNTRRSDAAGGNHYSNETVLIRAIAGEVHTVATF